MQKSMLKFCAVTCLIAATTITSIAALADSGKQGNGPTVQILMEKGNAAAGFQPMVINSRGEKTELTLATFLDAIAETWITGKASPTAQDKLDPNAVAYVRIDRKGDHASAMLFDFPVGTNPFRAKREQPATLGVLLGQAGQALYPGCEPKQMNGKSIDLKLTFKTDPNGVMSTYFVDPASGKEKEFNLGTMMAYTTYMLNKECIK